MSMLKAENVRKTFGGNQVLKGIDLEVNRGDVIAILGPSGSGKTTFLRCLNFLERADQGILTLDGQPHDMAAATKSEIVAIRRKTAFVFQNYNLFLNKTVLQNVTLGLTCARGMKKNEAEEIAREALNRVGMLGKAVRKAWGSTTWRMI